MMVLERTRLPACIADGQVSDGHEAIHPLLRRSVAVLSSASQSFPATASPFGAEMGMKKVRYAGSGQGEEVDVSLVLRA